MQNSLSLRSVAHRLQIHTQHTGRIARRSGKHASICGLAFSFVLISLLFSACSNPFGGGNASATPTVSAQQTLNKISWCATPSMVFRDEGAVTPTATSTATANSTPVAGPGTPSTITSWTLVKSKLGFTVYLPAALARGSCLVSAQATIHDPIYEGKGSFTIGYLLPDHTSLSISETPLMQSLDATFQCSSNSAPTSTNKSTVSLTPTASTALSQLCSGAKSTTSIVIAGPGSAAHVQQIFNALQPNITWIPAS